MEQVTTNGPGLPAPFLKLKDRPVMRVMGLRLMDSTRDDAVAWLVRRLDGGVQTRVAFPNAHCYNVAALDKRYRAALHSADALLPDGSGVAIAARMAGNRLRANLNGTDFVPALCTALAAGGHPVYLLGGRPGTAEAAAARLASLCPGLVIAGSRDGFFAHGGPESDGVVDAINASGASVLFVALGVPLQDMWLADNDGRLAPGLTMGVGGLFDFLAGNVSRAPEKLRRSGMEWTWRLFQEPVRMWRRYVLGNPLFLVRATVHAACALLPRRPPPYDLAKRALDLSASAVLLAMHAVPIAIMAVFVKVGSPGPAFIRQVRVGRDGVPFTMFKLRSMYVEGDSRRTALAASNIHGEDGITFKIVKDPRVTPVGSMLRRTSMDELPQLWNVFRGDMSLVGPRPQLPSEVARYERWQHGRLRAKPGITCTWQVGGRAQIPFAEQVRMDMLYIRDRSFLGDSRLLIMTVPAVLRKRGAY